MKKLLLLLVGQILVGLTAFGQPRDTMIAMNMPSSRVPDSLQSTTIVPEKTNPFSPVISTPTGSPDDIVSDNLNKSTLGFIHSYYRDNTKHLQVIQSKGEPYFLMIDNVFRKFGIPVELKYLAVIESGLNSNAVSRVGAVGTWQFMAGTARLMGLTVNKRHDDRRNLYKSTQAAAQYLNQLYDMLQDWLLVVAAYNCGPGGVLKAINASGSNNFWDLQKYLPAESRKHVMKFLATAYIMERFANFFGLDKGDLNNGNDIIPDKDPAAVSSADLANTRSVQISGKYCMPVIAKYLSMDINELNRLNPGFDKMMSGAANTYDLRLPADKMEAFKTNMNAILNESVQLMMENNRKIASAAALNVYPEARPVPVPVPVKHHSFRHPKSR